MHVEPQVRVTLFADHPDNDDSDHEFVLRWLDRPDTRFSPVRIWSPRLKILGLPSCSTALLRTLPG